MNAAKPQPLVTFAFASLCAFIFLAYCNISVFYSLYVYLEQLGVPQGWRGLIVGSSSLSTIAFYLGASPFLTAHNAPRNIFVGIGLLIGCGAAYLYATSAPLLLAVRLVNGAGVYLLSASALTLLVEIIPPNRSGQAFGLYSVAMLLPYSLVPFVFDIINPALGSPARGYALMSLALAPAALVNLLIARRAARAPRAAPAARPSPRDMLANAKRPAIALLLVINTVYYISFSAMFFLAKGLFLHRGIENVGYFFSIQTACMLVIRITANRFFDRVDKIHLVRFCYAATAASFALLFFSQALWAFYAAALVLGLGMGVGAPNLNALMFSISEPRFRAVNTNLMMMSLQAGSFAGPILGGMAVGAAGYAGFLLVGVAVNAAGILMTWPFVRLRARADARKTEG